MDYLDFPVVLDLLDHPVLLDGQVLQDFLVDLDSLGLQDLQEHLGILVHLDLLDPLVLPVDLVSVELMAQPDLRDLRDSLD